MELISFSFLFLTHVNIIELHKSRFVPTRPKKKKKNRAQLLGLSLVKHAIFCFFYWLLIVEHVIFLVFYWPTGNSLFF
jgi:hypothetical protein